MELPEVYVRLEQSGSYVVIGEYPNGVIVHLHRGDFNIVKSIELSAFGGSMAGTLSSDIWKGDHYEESPDLRRAKRLSIFSLILSLVSFGLSLVAWILYST